MQYDDVYNVIGQMGVYQVCVVLAMALFCMFTCDSITMIFVGAEMPHWCRVEPLSNFSYIRQKYIAIPYEPGEGQDYSSCKMFKLNYSSYSEEELMSWNRSLLVDDTTPIVDCQQWIYEQSTFVSTIISRFDLVCGSENLNELVSTIYMLGTVVGALVAGVLSDKLGRKSSAMVFLVVHYVGIGMSAAIPNYPVFIIGRFILGTGASACFLVGYVLAMETIGPSYRTLVGNMLQIGISIGFMLQPLIASSVRDDIWYQVASLAPIGVFVSFFIIVPESLRWSVVAGKYSQADEQLTYICRVNNVSRPENFDVRNFEDLAEEQRATSNTNITSLFRTSRLRQRTLIIIFIWFTCSMMYYGLSLNTGSLPGDIFLNTLISGTVEIPALLLGIFLMGWSVTGRRFTSCGSFLVAGAANLICIPMILYNYEVALTSMSMIGKAAITMTYSVIYVLASELFPTEARNVGMGIGSVAGGIGSMVAPYIGSPLAKIWKPLPSVVFGVLATAAGLLCCLLPEMLGRPLPDTIQQAEQITTRRELDSNRNETSTSSHDATKDVTIENTAYF